MMQAIAESGAGMSGASAVHMNIFGLNPVVVFGTEEQKRRMLPPLIAGARRPASRSPSRTPGSTRRSSRPRPCAKATATSSTARRCGSPPRRSPTRSCCWRAPRRWKKCKRPTEGFSLFYTDLDRSRIEVREIEKMGRKAVDSNQLFFDELRSARSPTASARRAGASSTSCTA